MNRTLVALVAVAAVLVLGVAIVIGVRKSNVSPALRTKVAVTSSAALVVQAKDLETKGNLVEAKAVYQRLTSEFPNAQEVMSWQKKVEELNIKFLFSSASTPKSTFYIVKPGDTLTKIAKEFKTTIELIKKSNNLPDDRIVPGKRIKVSTANFSIIIYKRQNILILKADDEIIKTYTIATGANGSTPVGTFKITNKLINPTWFKAGAVVPSDSPENVLGSRWLGFDAPGYGIHGTNEPQSVGKQVTQGCVRMTNADVEEIYSILPSGATVTIFD